MKHFPAKTRSIKLGAPFPGRSRDVAVDKPFPAKSPATRSASNTGKPPAKGVLLTGGGHG